jgi:hypothetical protein
MTLKRYEIGGDGEEREFPIATRYPRSGATAPQPILRVVR